jgi:glycosyltransferase involved in cell wall biosynthesis
MRTTIIIPTKNSVATIDECLSSLMPYHEDCYIDEILLVDGNSTDGTLDVAKNYPVKVLFEEIKGSIGRAYDEGWRNAQGEIVIFFDSDIYLGDGFFPKVNELISDDKTGWVSCQPKAVVTNMLTKAQAEDWLMGTYLLKPSTSWFQHLFSRFASGGKQEPLCGGPCMIVRRTCLEEVNGFRGLSPGTLKCCGDISVSQRIAGKGWKTIWWHDAPVYHHPRSTFKALIKQSYGYGKSMACMHMENEFRQGYPWYNKIISILARLASPVIGIHLAIRFHNPLHLIAYPLPRYAWVAGYIAGWAGAKRTS